MADNSLKVKFTPEIREAFDNKIAPILQETNKLGQYKVSYGVALAMLGMFDLPEDIVRELLIYCGLCTSAEIKQNLNGMGHFLNVAGFSNDELKALDAQYQETVRELREGAENHGKTH